MSGEFFPVPEYVIGRSDVSWGAKVLLGALYAYDRKGREWPCVAQLCDDMKGQPRRTITRWLEELTGAGLVTSKRDGRGVLYAPATCAKTGARRDLDPAPVHAPELAQVRAPELAHLEPEHAPELAQVHAPELAHFEPERAPELAHAADPAPITGVKKLNTQSARVRECASAGVPAGARVARGLGFLPTTTTSSRLREVANAYGAAYRRANDGRVWLAQSALDAIERGAPALPHRAIAEQLAAIVGWLDAQPEDRLAAVIAGAFADPWMVQNGYPLGRIAADPAKFAAPAPKAPTPAIAGARPEPWLDAQQRARDEWSRRAHAEKVPPPEDLVSALRQRRANP